MPLILQGFADKLFERTAYLYSALLLLIIALKWPFFAMQPVWDDAFSIFPAADFLVQNGFDYSLLLTQPGYHDGGPTAHALSLLTFITALILKITGGGILAWVVLHTAQWLMAAAIGTILARLYSSLFDKITGLLLAVASLAYPLMLAQLGYMYLEVPLLFFSLLAFYNYRHDRMWLASLCLLAACLTKGSGIIAVGAICCVELFSKDKMIKTRLLGFFILLLPSLSVLLAMSMMSNQLSFSAPSNSGSFFSMILHRNFSAYRMYIATMPELIFIFAGSVFISIFILSENIVRRIKSMQNVSDIVMYNCLLILAFTVFHFIMYAYIQTSDSHFLSRYFFFVIPSMFLVLFYSIAKMLLNHKIKLLLLALVIGICLINRGGILYPALPFPSIAVAERSEEYVNGYTIQRQYINLIENKVPHNVPVYVGLPDYFLMHYSVSRYVQKPLSNVHYIKDIMKANGNNFIFPNHFVLVISYPWLGGAEIRQIIRHAANRDHEFSLEILGSFKKECFEAYVVEIKKMI